MSGWISTRRQKKQNRVRSWGDKQQQDKKAGYLEKIMKTIDGFEDENGNLPRGTIKRIIKEEQLNLPWLSGHQIYSLRKRRVKTKRHEAKMALLANNFDTTEITENTKEINETSDISPSLHDDECSFDSFGSENRFYDIEQIATAGTIIIPFDFKTTVGRKKGSSSDAKAVAKRRSSELVDEIATTWYEIAFDVGDNTKLFELITIRKHMARSDQYISENTIRSRVKRRNTSDVHQGRTSPMCKAEPTLCCLLKYASRMGQHVTQSECIAMANELIKDRPIGKEVAAWKLKYVHACRERFQFDSNYYPKAEVGWGWFRGFQRRYSEITLKYVSNIKHYRSTWSTYAMLENMYKDVYAQFAKWGVAYKNDKPEWQDEFGNKVEKEDAMGAPVEYEMLWPDRVLTMDETGDRGNQADDPATRGDKVICETDGTQPKKGAAVDDSSWTVQGFTTLSGRAVLMVIIMKKASILDYNEYHGYDLEAPWIGDGEDVCVDGELPTQEQINRNKGAYRRFPGALTIEFNGIKIPSLVFATKGGGVNEDILVEALEHLDKLNVFPRKEGVPNPTLLVDGHGSRLQPKFVQYVNNLKADFSPDDEADHKWNVAIGLPHSTHHWQVGDSPEENQAFKFHSRVKKDKIVKFQAQLSITPQIKRYHAVPICNYAFRRSFMRCDSVKRAIAERGWNPCNMNCLYSKEVIQTQVSTALTDERKDLTAAELACIKQGEKVIGEFNLNGDLTVQVFQNCNQQQARLKEQDAALKKKREEQKKNGGAMIDVVGRITSGMMYDNGIVSVNDPNLIDLLKAKQDKKDEVEWAKECKKYIKAKKNFDAGQSLYVDNKAAKELNPSGVLPLSNVDLETLIKWKWSALSEQERPKLSSLKATSRQETRRLKLDAWEFWERGIDPCPPLMPADFHLYEEGTFQEVKLPNADLRPTAFPNLKKVGDNAGVVVLEDKGDDELEESQTVVATNQTVVDDTVTEDDGSSKALQEEYEDGNQSDYSFDSYQRMVFQLPRSKLISAPPQSD